MPDDLLRLIHGDARAIPLGDNSVQCIVTSPPYWGLRKYAGAQELVWGGAEKCEHEWTDESRSTQRNRNGCAGGRRAVLLDLAYDAEYANLAEARTRNVQIELPSHA